MSLLGTPLGSMCDNMFRLALAEPIGGLVKVNNTFRAKHILYRYRRELGDRELYNIQILIGPDPEHVLFLRNKPEDNAQEYANQFGNPTQEIQI